MGVRPLGIKSNLYSCKIAGYAEFLLLTALVKVLGCLGSKLLLFTDFYRYSLVNRQTSIEKFSNTSWHKIHWYIWSAFIYLLWGEREVRKVSLFRKPASKEDGGLGS